MSSSAEANGELAVDVEGVAREVGERVVVDDLAMQVRRGGARISRPKKWQPQRPFLNPLRTPPAGCRERHLPGL